ncbi:MAG: hypothetical protein GY835_06485 [bacterium]|nr:hypothetical protein [bacterium]
MTVLSQGGGYLLIVIFGVVMVGLTLLVSRDPRWKTTGAGFLVAGREVTWKVGATSIAASWIWAPALFVSVQKAYELGLPGIFWFTAPNILALVIFAWLAPRIREKIPGGYTLPDWIKYRLNDKKLHGIYLVPFLWYQVMAITVQIFVGGLMINFLTGIPLNAVMSLLLVIGLSYSLISGLRASVVTDFLQMIFIVVGLAITIPWVASVAGEGAISKGFGGLAGNTNIFDPKVAFSFGIVTSIGLIAGALSDQQYWQRSFAIKQDHLKKAFIFGGILFGVVPIVLSILGFLAANPDMGIAAPEGTGLPMIGIATVVNLLPQSAAIFFVVMLLAGLCSTLDSGLCAASSLYSIDMAKLSEAEREVLRKERIGLDLSKEDAKAREFLNERTTTRARIGMFGIAIVGLITAFIVQHLFSLDRLWWIFNGVASCFVVPTVLSVFWDRLSAKGAFYGILGSLVGMVFFIYGNWVQNDVITVFSAIFIVVISVVFCLAFKRETAWTG